MNLSSHSCSAIGPRRPRREDVLAWVDEGSGPNDCWSWLATTPERRFNRRGHAVWAWKYRANYPRVTLIVARLLLESFLGPFPPRPTFRSRCGHQACVNPHHWMLVPRPVVYMLTVNEHDWWYPVYLRDGTRAPRDLILRLQHDGVVHVAPVRQDAAPSYTALCGAVLAPGRCIVHALDALVTCKDGC